MNKKKCKKSKEAKKCPKTCGLCPTIPPTNSPPDGQCFQDADCGTDQTCHPTCGLCYCSDGFLPNENGECPPPIDACPPGSDPNNYKTVLGNCYFFDKTFRN